LQNVSNILATILTKEYNIIYTTATKEILYHKLPLLFHFLLLPSIHSNQNGTGKNWLERGWGIIAQWINLWAGSLKVELYSKKDILYSANIKAGK